jgi:hypothetical protein
MAQEPDKGCQWLSPGHLWLADGKLKELADMLNDITNVKKISSRSAFKAKADSSNRHRRTRCRST